MVINEKFKEGDKVWRLNLLMPDFADPLTIVKVHTHPITGYEIYECQEQGSSPLGYLGFYRGTDIIHAT